MRFRSVAIPLSCLLIAASVGHAQDTLTWRPGFTLGVGVGRYFPAGGNLEPVDTGLGFEGYVGYRVLGRSEVSVTFHLSSHGVTPSLPNVQVLGVFLEPRLYFPTQSTPLAVFIGARTGYLRGSLSTSTRVYRSSSLGIGFNVGMIHRLAGAIQLEVLGGADFMGLDAVVGEDRGMGHALGIRAGLRFLFGKPGAARSREYSRRVTGAMTASGDFATIVL